MTTDDAVHAERREPSQPEGPLDLAAAGEELLASARELAAKRSARTLTPGIGALLKQTLMALCGGSELAEHPAPGPTTIQVLKGDVTLTAGDISHDLSAGQWAVVPQRNHDLVAHSDAVVLLTVVHEQAA